MPDHPDEQRARLKSLNAVYQALSAVELSAFSLPLLLQVVLETGTKLTGAKYGALGVFDESGTRLTEFITVGLDEETKKRTGTLPVGLGLLRAMNDEPGVLRLRDLSQHPKSIGFPPHHPSMKSFLGISIRAHGRIFGRLYLTEKQDAEEFSEVDAEIVAALAAQAGTILERGLLIEQLKSAESRHRQILESASEGIYGLDLDGICTFINKAGAAMLGYRPEELTGRRMHSLVHHTRPDGLPYPEEECPTERSRRHGRPSHLIEDSYWRKDGTSFPVQLSCAPLVRDGALLGAVVTFFDITERKQAEMRKVLDYSITQALIESTTVEETNQKVLQVVCGVLGWEWSAVWEVDKQANVLRPMMIWHKPEFAAPEFEAITRKMTFAPGVGLPGRVWSTGAPAYIPDVTRDRNFPRAPSATQAGLRGGFAFPVQLGGDIIGVMEFFSRETREPSRDVMDLLDTLGSQIGLQIARKRAEETIRESRDYYLKLLEEFPAPIWKSGLDAKSDYFNKSWLAFTGRTLEQELGDGWAEGVHPEDRDRCMMTYLAAFRAREPFEMEYRLRYYDGEYHSIIDIGRPYFDLDGNFAGFIGSVYDITERKQTEEALRQAHGCLQIAQEEERKRIAREIHDELGQQLTMLRFGLVKLAETEPSSLAELRKKARALTKPVDTMIDTVRRIATALRPSILDDLGLAAALEWLITDFRAKTDIPCEASLAPLPAELDENRSLALFRILQEALTNIARHAQATRVTISLQQTAEALVLEVHDNGHGLTEAQRTSPDAIGLFGMQERALLVGGTVTIQSRPGKGTTVTARIPIR